MRQVRVYKISLLNSHGDSKAVLIIMVQSCVQGIVKEHGSHKANSSEGSKRAEAQIWEKGSRQGVDVEPEVETRSRDLTHQDDA